MPSTRQIRDAKGTLVWDLDAYRFLDAPAPDTASPSLWRQGQLLLRDGLYEVVPGIYQLRGFDLSLMSVIEGDTGVIVIDPLTTRRRPPPRSRCTPSTVGSGRCGR